VRRAGMSWVPPRDPPRKDGPLEPPALDGLADAEETGADAEETGTKAATRQAATSDRADPFDAAAPAFFDDLGEPGDGLGHLTLALPQPR